MILTVYTCHLLTLIVIYNIYGCRTRPEQLQDPEASLGIAGGHLTSTFVPQSHSDKIARKCYYGDMC